MSGKILPITARTFALLSALLLASASLAAASEQTIYSFTGGASGASPHSNLVIGASGHLFGTTLSGGNQACSGGGCGTVFELAPKAGGGWNYHTLYMFKGGHDGATPMGNIVFDAAGNLYGTTSTQGAAGHGAVYELTPHGNLWTERLIYSFAGYPDGDEPVAGLTIDSAGNLYGTTNSGGSAGVGSVYKVSPNSNGTWSESVLYSLGTQSNDGEFTWAEVVFDTAGNLYGTTVLGGAAGYGTVFKLTPSSSGGWNETVLYSFTNQADQGIPKTPVWLDAQGNIFGAASDDGEPGAGIVFELIPNSHGTWTEKTIHTFGATGDDGYRPYSSLTPDAAGNLYGTTFIGGAHGAGCVFRLHLASSGWTESVLYSFTGNADGNAPTVGLTLGSGGIFYGSTQIGGTSQLGVLFAIKP